MYFVRVPSHSLLRQLEPRNLHPAGSVRLSPSTKVPTNQVRRSRLDMDCMETKRPVGTAAGIRTVATSRASPGPGFDRHNRGAFTT